MNLHRARLSVPLFIVTLLAFGLMPGSVAAQVAVLDEGSDSEIRLDKLSLRHTKAEVVDARQIPLPGSKIQLVTWGERDGEGGEALFYAVSLDGTRVDTVRQTSYDLLLRWARFDPRAEAPAIASALTAQADGRLAIVQLASQPLAPMHRELKDAGARVLAYLAHHAFIVELSGSGARTRLEALPFVRWIGPYHPAYKLEEGLAEGLLGPVATLPRQRYHLQVTGGDSAAKVVLAAQVEAVGGVVESLRGTSPILDATLTAEQLRQLIHRDELFFVDRWLPIQTYMDNVRIDGGANFVEVEGFTGTGVRAEVMDTGLLTTHQDWALPPIISTTNNGSQSHGTSVFGIVFGDGTGNAAARGMLPDAQGIFAQSTFNNRTGHIADLVQAPYFAVFQTNSWGSCCTTAYTTESMEIDDIVFDNDIVILQAQANNGNRNSDVSAWAKNIVSVGGIRHSNTLDLSDDAWNNAGSIGPADDGRVKPDLSYWYDSIQTTSSTGGYTTGFGGTSAATPMTAGHFGLMFEMWSNGIFGNLVEEQGTVFDNRPHSTTAKALMINTANPYDFTGPGHDLTRAHQGWGRANVANLYERRNDLFVVDETDVLQNLGSTTYDLTVPAGTPSFKATLVYLDPAGTTSSSQHRINDLTLEVTTPSGTTYFGNNGLLDGNESVADGMPNTIDTVENVWVQNPEAGVWQVTVHADEINQDSHVETIEIDADYALVVSGVEASSLLFGDGFESGDTTAWSQTVP